MPMIDHAKAVVGSFFTLRGEKRTYKKKIRGRRPSASNLFSFFAHRAKNEKQKEGKYRNECTPNQRARPHANYHCRRPLVGRSSDGRATAPAVLCAFSGYQ